MKRLRVSSAAERDLDDVWIYVASHSGSGDIADRLIESLVETFSLLLQVPGVGTLREEIAPGVRGFPVGKYIIYYRESGSYVDIARVLHGMRDQRAAYARTS